MNLRRYFAVWLDACCLLFIIAILPFILIVAAGVYIVAGIAEIHRRAMTEAKK